MKNKPAYSLPPRKILAALDGSACSEFAWLHAKALSKKFHARVEALYVREYPYALAIEGIPDDTVDSIQKRSIQRIRSWLGQGVPLKVESGDAIQAVLNRAKKGKYDMIVIGTHGRKGLERALLGSVAESVVRRSEVPVLIVRTKPAPIRSILAPVNFAPYAKAGFDYAVQTALATKSQLVAFHVAPDWEDIKRINDKFDDLISSVPPKVRRFCKVERFMDTGSPVGRILSEARYHSLVVATAHRKQLLKDLVLGTTAERLMRYSPVPVLAVPAAVFPAVTARSKRSKKSVFEVV